MLKDRILSTLHFFDLQDLPLSLTELHNFLLDEVESIKLKLDAQWEVQDNSSPVIMPISMGEILKCLDEECGEDVESRNGYYCLKGRVSIIDTRLHNYVYGLKREKRIKKYAKYLAFIPFVRGVALAGSQAFGQQKKDSDIDLLIITDESYMWLARSLVTTYFQIIGKRRHGRLIANRFCLNHYMNHPKQITKLRNIYTASEYAKLCPLTGNSYVSKFQKENEGWIGLFFPQARFISPVFIKKSSVQTLLEKILDNSFGHWLNKISRKIQLPRIRQESSDFAEEDELSFHPNSKQQYLLKSFFG